MENITLGVLTLWALLSVFLAFVPKPPILSQKGMFGNLIFLICFIALILLEKLYRKYKDRTILLIMVVIILLLIGGFFVINL